MSKSTQNTSERNPPVIDMDVMWEGEIEKYFARLDAEDEYDRIAGDMARLEGWPS